MPTCRPAQSTPSRLRVPGNKVSSWRRLDARWSSTGQQRERGSRQADEYLPVADGDVTFDPVSAWLTGVVLVSELAARFAGTYAYTVLWTHVRKAIGDLHGSVTADALPEMAARLTSHRLAWVEPSPAAQ